MITRKQSLHHVVCHFAFEVLSLLGQHELVSNVEGLPVYRLRYSEKLLEGLESFDLTQFPSLRLAIGLFVQVDVLDILLCCNLFLILPRKLLKDVRLFTRFKDNSWLSICLLYCSLLFSYRFFLD